MSAPTAPARESLREYASCSGQTLRVDRDKGVVPNVKILGLQSKNGRVYTAECAAKAMPLYEGCACFVDHARRGESRSYRDRIGGLMNVNARADGLYADFHVNMRHPLAEQICWDVEHSPANCGFSHDCEAMVDKRDGQTVVTEIASVHSVDLVAKPATVKSLFESEDLPDDPDVRELAEHSFSAMSDCKLAILEKTTDVAAKRQRLLEITSLWRHELEGCESNCPHCAAANAIASTLHGDGDAGTKKQNTLSVMADWESKTSTVPSASGATKPQESQNVELKDLTMAMLKEHRTDLVEQLTGTDAISKLTAEVKTIKEALDAEKAKTLALETEKANLALNAKIADELKEAKLDVSNKSHVSEVFMASLVSAKDAAARKSLIEDRLSLIKTNTPAAAPFSSIGTSEGTATSLSATLAKLRG